MRSRSLTRVLAAMAVAATVAAGCGAPEDETLLRFLGFRSPGGTDNISVVNADLLDDVTDNVDATFENTTLTVGRDNAAGTGILVYRIRVEYTIKGASPPSYEYPVTLYLPPPTKAGESSSGTLFEIPIVPALLKEWILDSDVSTDSAVHLTARMTFSAKTDEGGDLDVDGSIPIVLSTSGGIGSKPTVSIAATDAQAKETPLETGAFTVSLDSATDTDLTIRYSLKTGSGQATSGTDYQALDGSVDIFANTKTATITVTPIADSTAEDDETVVVTLSAGSGYNLGSKKSATVTIQD